MLNIRSNNNSHVELQCMAYSYLCSFIAMVYFVVSGYRGVILSEVINRPINSKDLLLPKPCVFLAIYVIAQLHKQHLYEIVEKSYEN